MVEITEKFIEAVVGRQVFVPVTLVILAELTRRVTLAFQHGGHGYVGLLPSLFRTRQSDLGHSGAHRHIAADECRSAGCAALLSVVIRESNAFVGDPVDVRSLVSHHAQIAVADVPGADVVSPDDEDVGLFGRVCRGGNSQQTTGDQ